MITIIDLYDKFSQEEWDLKINSDSYKLKHNYSSFHPSTYFRIQVIIKNIFNICTTTNQVEVLWERWFKKCYGNSCVGASVYDREDEKSVISAFIWYMTK